MYDASYVAIISLHKMIYQRQNIVIMHTNDVHSRVQGSEYDTYLGYATVKSVKDKVEEYFSLIIRCWRCVTWITNSKLI